MILANKLLWKSPAGSAAKAGAFPCLAAACAKASRPTAGPDARGRSMVDRALVLAATSGPKGSGRRRWGRDESLLAMRALIDAGAEPSPQGLAACARHGFPESLELYGQLCKAWKVKINAKDELGRTACFAACERSNPADALWAIQSLAEMGCDLDRKDRRGWAPFHAALALGRLDLLSALIRAGAGLWPNAKGVDPIRFGLSQGMPLEDLRGLGDRIRSAGQALIIANEIRIGELERQIAELSEDGAASEPARSPGPSRL